MFENYAARGRAFKAEIARLRHEGALSGGSARQTA